jgi:hypothetical protein
MVGDEVVWVSPDRQHRKCIVSKVNRGPEYTYNLEDENGVLIKNGALTAELRLSN